MDKQYTFQELLLGKKRPRKSKKNPKPQLTAAEKEANKAINKERIFVEHAIGKMKKFHILKNRCRLKCEKLKNRVLGICAGLWNYYLDKSTSK